MLPTALALDGRYGNCRVAAHSADEKPGGRDKRHERRDGSGTLSELLSQQGCHRPSEERHTIRTDQAAVCGSRVADQGGVCGIPEVGEDLVLCHRRGTLYFGMGPRLPSGIPTHQTHHRSDRQCPRDSPHGNGDRQGAHGHQEEPRHHPGQRVQELLQPSEPIL